MAALGTHGPILVYSSFEAQRIAGLAKRFGDLAPQLNALLDRLVDLYGPTKAHYYHPDMHGSWSIKDVAPTIASELRYETLGEVRDGGAAGRAYLEAIDPATSAERREHLRRDMLEYCGHDTLALMKVVEVFSRSRAESSQPVLPGSRRSSAELD